MAVDERLPDGAGRSAPTKARCWLRASRRGSALVLGSPFWGWAGPVLIMIFGGFLRFYRLSQPRAVVFDETYYVPDANSILRHGVELQHFSNVNNSWCAATRTSSCKA